MTVRAIAAGFAAVVVLSLEPLVAAAPATERARAVGPSSVPRAGLATAMFDPERFDSPSSARYFALARASGATLVRLSLFWPAIAPKVRSVPADFTATDPAERGYSWTNFDLQVKRATARGFAPIVTISGAPIWAQAGDDPAAPSRVNAAEYGKFAKAASRRYSGMFQDLPRIRYWEAWSEPNITTFLRPQLIRGRPVAARNYRQLVNAFAAAVKGVHEDNLVIAGGLAPFRDSTQEIVDQDEDWGPLSFMRELFCLTPALRSKCRAPVRFDVWSIHPYTSGAPTRHAVLPNDVSLGDLPDVKATLAAARRAGNIVGAAPTRLWVTEFSWDSSPPDPKGVPMALLSRWVAEAQYVMWRNGVSLVTWFTVADDGTKESYFQSGLHFRSGRAKPIRRAFRFPVVAIPNLGGTLVWGRTPLGRQQRVLVEHSPRGRVRWRKLDVLKPGPTGIFRRVFRVRPTGTIRARIVETGERALPFGIEPVPDMFFNPFGTTPPLEPGG